MVTAVGNPDVGKGTAVITLDQGLKYPHWRSSRTLSTPYQPTFSNHKSAGFGVISGCDPGSNLLNGGSSCFFGVDLRSEENVFNDAFVEVFAPRAGMNALPFVGPPFFDSREMAPGGTCASPKVKVRDNYDFSPWVDFVGTWFANLLTPNYVWDGGVGTTPPLKEGSTECKVCGYNPLPEMWATTFAWPSSSTYVLVGAVESYCMPATMETTGIQETSAHELAHQYFVNKGTTQTGHDDRCQWIASGAEGCGVTPTQCGSASDACLMSDARDRWDFTHRLDRFDLLCGDPGCPNGTVGCCDSCALEGNGSIRQLQDPIPGGQP